jgi:CubicO group peptidase (beta-lactamase class C family)
VSGQPFSQFLQSASSRRAVVDGGLGTQGQACPSRRRAGASAPTPFANSDVGKPQTFFSGGGHRLRSSDFLRFCQMLLNGGELDGVRIFPKRSG